MKDHYIFPAVFTEEERGVSIVFPDLPGCCPCADTPEEAFRNAKEALQLHLYGMEEDGEEIPVPSHAGALRHTEGQAIAMIDAWMPPFRERMRNKPTNKTVTIPRWLDLEARREKVDLSRLLQESLKQYLGVTEGKIQHFSV